MMDTAATTRRVSNAPVVLWATLGAAFLAVAAYVWGSWLLSPVFRPAPVGPDPLPGNVNLTLWICQALGGLTGVLVGVIFVARPLWHERRLTTDGMLALNFLLIWWMDPMVNYYNFSFSYNSHALNMGSWASFIPGWSYPNSENFPEPIVMMGGFYLGYWMLTTVLGCWLMRKLRDWKPGLHVGLSLLAVFATCFLIDLLTELLILRTGLAAYPGVVSALSVYPSRVYQWPLYEGLGVGLACLGFTALRHFKDDRGQTFVERGIERLNLSSRKLGLVRFLALGGAIQSIMLLGFYVTYNLFMVHIDTFPAYPSYIRDMMCGEGTSYACPNKYWVPIPTRDAKIYLTPTDPRLPETVRNEQGISHLGKDPYAAN